MKGASLLPQIKSKIAQIFFKAKNTSGPYILTLSLFFFFFFPKTYFILLPPVVIYPRTFSFLIFKIQDV